MSLLAEDVRHVQAADLVAMLRRHYLPERRAPGGIFAAEIESPDGRRRADALWAPWSIAGGAGLVGHEIKVSRSDVLAELTDPMKAEPWAQYCSWWWLVVSHPSLVEGLDVPSAWGIMSPPSGRRTRTMTVIRQAPRLKPTETGPGWRRIAAWETHRLTRQLEELAYKAQRHERDAEWARRELAQRDLAGFGREHRRAAEIGRILTELDQRRWDSGPVDVDAVVAAIVDLEAHRQLVTRARQEIEHLADTARRIAQPMEDVARQLDRLAEAPDER